jgi:hypothetical protein
MNTISQKDSSDNFKSSLKQLFSYLGVSALLKQSNFKKRAGYGASVYELFFMVFSSCFFSKNKTVHGNFTASKQTNVCSSKSSLYRFLSNEHNNWRKFLLLLASRVISKIKHLSNSDRKFCFVLDDSVLERAKGKEVELLARIHDHVSQSFVKGFTCIQLGWTDGNSYIPVNNALLSSSKEENRYCEASVAIDHRCCGFMRRAEAQLKKTLVAINLIKQSLNAGICADYVLMDSWFTTEPFIQEVTALGLDVIGMVKALKQRYWYNGKQLNLRKLYQAIPNKHNADIICSAKVKTKNGINVKIVFIRNRNSHREYLALLSTDLNISDEDIVRQYSKRWLIETNFRAQKQYFKLGTETYARNYDNLISFMTMSSVRYVIMEFSRRYNSDTRSLGELFRNTSEQLEDIPFIDAIDSLMRCFSNLAKELDAAKLLKPGCIAKAEKLINDKLSSWFTGICQYLQDIFTTYNLCKISI